MAASPKSDHLVVFEGPDGVGKTTISMAVLAELEKRGIQCRYVSFPGREPGTLGHLVYGIHHDPEGVGVTQGIHPVSLQVLHVAAHINTIEGLIAPMLDAGAWIVLDRFWWSTWVYGTLAELPVESRNQMIDLEKTHWRNIRPAAVFLVDRATQSPLSAQLRELYGQLAATEEGSYPITALDNSGPVEVAVRAALETLGLP